MHRYKEQEKGRIAEMILDGLAGSDFSATILGLQGDLGAGKTALTAEIARMLGVQESLISPTFVIAKFYSCDGGGFERVIHIDAYRIESIDELAAINFAGMLRSPRTLIVIEWPERIKDALPNTATIFAITHHDQERAIKKITP